MEAVYTDSERNLSHGPTPTATLDETDPGDETQRNFRYQHAYGVILLLAAARGAKPYAAIWCEHHEDFLGERHDGLFDGYQVKTRRPELGPWDLYDEGLKSSIKRFVEVDSRFPNKIGNLYVVSNADYFSCAPDIKDKGRLARSPAAFLAQATACGDHTTLAQPFVSPFFALQNFCKCSADQLLRTLQKTKLIKGPGRDSFDAELAHDHLGTLEECAELSPAAIDSLRDELIQRVYLASSLAVADPSKHWCVIEGTHSENPKLAAKRIPVADVKQVINEPSLVPFRYIDSGATLDLGTGRGNVSTMKRKLIRGGLALQTITMGRRALSAEQRLIERAHMNPERINSVLNQLVSVVQGECDEAYNRASLCEHLFGRQMLDDVLNRLRVLATDRPEQVEGEPYESLVGIAGLLTGECKVWWSEPFDLEEDE